MVKAEAKDYKLIEKYLTNLNEHLQKYFSKIGTIEIKEKSDLMQINCNIKSLKTNCFNWITWFRVSRKNCIRYFSK